MKKKLNKKIKQFSVFLNLSLASSLVLAACSIASSNSINQPEISVGNRLNYATGGLLDQNNFYSLKNFSKTILENTTASNLIINEFAKQLIFEWYQKQAKLKSDSMVSFTKAIPQKFNDLVKKTDEEYKKKVSDSGGLDSAQSKNLFQQNVLDKNGGNEATYKHRQILNQLYQDFKSEFGKLSTDNFNLLPNSMRTSNGHDGLTVDDKNIIYGNNNLLTKSEIENSTNWNKIGFYPKLREFDQKTENKAIAIGFANFNQFVYDKWQSNVKPFNVTMSLWKYDANASENNLLTVYNKTTLGSLFPTKADYQFPYYGSDSNQTTNSTAIKFKQFITNIDLLTPGESNFSNTSSNFAFNIPNGYTDDSGTSIYADASSIFDKLYPQFAAAAIHKFIQATAGSDLAGSSGSEDKDTKKTNPLTADINSIKKESLKDKDLINLFLESTKTEGQIGIEIDKNIFNNASKYKDSAFVMDQRDVENSPWIFLRNEAGVHAIAIDGYNYIKNITSNGSGESKTSSSTTADHLKRSYQFYNYRVLEKINAERLNIKKAIQIDPLKEANDFYTKNFDALITSYYLKNLNQANSLFAGIENPILKVLGSLRINGQWDMAPANVMVDFKKVLESLIAINFAEPKLKKVHEIGEKLQSKYETYSLNFKNDSTDKSKFFSDLKNGLAAAIPYPLDTCFTSSTEKDVSTGESVSKNLGRYTSLSAIYDNKAYDDQADLYNYSTSLSDTSSNVNNYKKLQTDYQTHLNKVLNTLKFGDIFDPNTQFPTGTKVILGNSFLFNAVLDGYIGSGGTSNNLTNIISVNQLTHNYLSKIFDLKTNKIKADSQLGDDFKSLFNDNQYLPINDAIANLYYSKTYVNSKYPLTYGGYDHSDSSSSTASSSTGASSRSDSAGSSSGKTSKVDKEVSAFNKKQESIFDNNFYYQSNLGYSMYSTENVDYLNFLKSLVYLTENRFENLRLYLRNVISADTKAAFSWTINIPKSEISSLSGDSKVIEKFGEFNLNYKNKLLNPFFDSKILTSNANKNYNYSLAFTSTNSSYTSEDNSASFSQTFKGFNGLVIDSPSQTWTSATDQSVITNALSNLRSYTNNGKNGLLFNFGLSDDNKSNDKTSTSLNSRKALIKFVQNFDSVSQVEKLASNLQQLIGTLTVDAINAQTVTIKIGSATKIRALTFNEKRNALLALINNYKLPSTSTSIDESEFKKIYGTNPSQEFQSLNNTYTLQTSGSDYKENIDKKLFDRLAGVLSSSSINSENKYAFSVDNDFSKLAYIIQVNQSDFASAANFMKFVKKYLGDKTFAAWLVQLANESFIQSLAATDVNSKIVKFTVHDVRFQDALSSTYILNKQ